jgi:hypothetical protein
VEDLERRHDGRLLEEAAVGLGGHAEERADALAVDEDRVAQHMGGMGNWMGDDFVLAHHEALALDDWNRHATFPEVRGSSWEDEHYDTKTTLNHGISDVLRGFPRFQELSRRGREPE